MNRVLGHGIDVLGADSGGLIGAAPDWLKKAGQAVVPAAASAAEGALADKPADGSKPGDKKGGAKPSDSSSPGFFSTVIVGPVKVWMAFVAAAVAGGGIYLWKRK